VTAQKTIRSAWRPSTPTAEHDAPAFGGARSRGKKISKAAGFPQKKHVNHPGQKSSFQRALYSTGSTTWLNEKKGTPETRPFGGKELYLSWRGRRGRVGAREEGSPLDGTWKGGTLRM